MSDKLFTITTYERTIEFMEDGSDDYTDETEDMGTVPADLRAVLDALDSQCWDSIDISDDRTILYPADSDQDMTTGAWIQTQIVIRGNVRNIERALDVWRSRRDARRIGID